MNAFNPYPWIFGTNTERVFWKKNHNHRRWRHSWDLEDQNYMYRYYLPDRVSVGLSYDANFKWHMPIWGEVCRAEQNNTIMLTIKQYQYANFGSVTERDFRKNSIAQKHIQIGSMLRSGYFFREMRSVTAPRFGFFPKDSRTENLG